MARKKIHARYWDADAFIGWMAEEPGKVDECRGVMKEAEAGRVTLVTSALTLVEVIKLKAHAPLPPKKAEEITKFFQQSFIIIRDLDRPTGELARTYVWEYGLGYKDAVHLATAVRAKLKQLDTFDEQLLKLDGKVGDPPLAISHPNVPEQLELNYEQEDGEEEASS